MDISTGAAVISAICALIPYISRWHRRLREWAIIKRSVKPINMDNMQQRIPPMANQAIPQSDVEIIRSMRERLGEYNFSSVLTEALGDFFKPPKLKKDFTGFPNEMFGFKKPGRSTNPSCCIDHLQESGAKKDGTKVYHSHTYDMSKSSLERLIRFCNDNGLDFDVSPKSWYRFGEALLVNIRPKETPPRNLISKSAKQDEIVDFEL